MINKKIRIIFVIIFFVGLFILLYPLVSRCWNSRVQSRAITLYNKKISDSSDYNDMFMEADNYNKELLELDFPLIQYDDISNYSSLLDFSNNGMMGYIVINKIGVEIPIYHGTSSSVLNVGVGHLKGTSLPIGGNSTHSVLAGHSGLPSAKLFTNLNRLEVGDTFVITVIDRKLIYQVDKIVIVEPTDVSNLEIVEGNDYVTLITCTPYGLNTHRLLVRGSRIDDVVNNQLVIMSDAYQIDKLAVMLVISFVIIFLLVIYIMINLVVRKFVKMVYY